MPMLSRSRERLCGWVWRFALRLGQTMSELATVRVTQGQLPELCARLIGHELRDRQVGFIAVSANGIEHAGVLEPFGGIDADQFLRLCGADVDQVHLVAQGIDAESLALLWAHALSQTPSAAQANPRALVGSVITVTDQGWYQATNSDIGGSLERLPPAVLALVPAAPQPSPQDVVARLLPGGPPHDVSEGQARVARQFVQRMQSVQSPTEQVALAENILLSWEDKLPIDDDLAHITGNPDMGSTALFCALVETDVVRDSVIATATEKPATVRALVEASKAANSQARVGVTTAAGTALWLTGTDGHGPVGSAAAAGMLHPVSQVSELAKHVHAAALAGEDPRPVAARVRASAEIALDAAEHNWVTSQAQSPSRTTVAGAGHLAQATPAPAVQGVR